MTTLRVEERLNRIEAGIARIDARLRSLEERLDQQDPTRLGRRNSLHPPDPDKEPVTT